MSATSVKNWVSGNYRKIPEIHGLLKQAIVGANAAVVKTIRDSTGSMAGQLVMIDFSQGDGDFEVSSLGARLQLYGFSRAEIEAAAPASLLPTVVSVTS